MSGHRYPPLDHNRATPLTTPSCVLITAPTQHIVPMRCLEICGISCFTTFPIYSMGHGVPCYLSPSQPPYLYPYRCDIVSTAYCIYHIYQPLHLAYILYLVFFYIFLYEILYYYRLRIFPARHLVAYLTYTPYILYRYDILYHLSYLYPISCVFLYLVVSMYIGTISWMV